MEEVNQPIQPPQTPNEMQSSVGHHNSKLFLFLLSAVILILVGAGSYILGTNKNKIPTTQTLQCKIDVDCEDNNVCTDDACVKGVCSNSNSVEGKSCGVNLPDVGTTNFCDGAGKCVYRGPIQPGPLEDPETANWKIYKNVTYGFGIRYPQDFAVINDTLSKTFSGTLKRENLEISNNITPENPRLTVWVNLLGVGGRPTDIDYDLAPTENKGLRIALRTEIPESQEWIDNHTTDNEVVIVGKTVKLGANIYDFEFAFKDGGKDYEFIFEQILSTFKFTDQNQAIDETANWKTYKSTSFGIEIKYPPNWGLEEPTMANNAIYLNSNGSSDGPGDQPYVFIGKSENLEGLPFKEFATQGLSSEIKNNFTYSKEIIKGYTAYKTTSLPAMNSTLNVYIAKDSTEKEFIYFGFQPDVPSDKTISTIYDQILSTFQFIDNNSTNDNLQDEG